MKKSIKTASYRLSALLAPVMLLCGVTAHAWEDTDRAVEEWSTLSEDYVTPHTRWAKPYAGGRLRILYCVASNEQGMRTHAREVVELRQRLDADIDVIYEISFYGAKWFGGLAGNRRISRLMDNDYDVYMFQDITPGKIPPWPESPQTRMINRVKSGAGVVIIGSDVNAYKKGKVEYFSEKQEVEITSPFLKGVPVEKASTFGKGRLLELPARPRILYKVGWEVEYDHWQEKLVRAVLWAAKKEPSAHLTVEAPETLERGSLPARLRLSWADAPRGAKGRARLRRWDGEIVKRWRFDCGKPKGAGTLTVPTVRSGRYFVEAFVSSGAPAAVHAWTLEPIDISADSRIESIDFSTGTVVPFGHVEKQDPNEQRALDQELGTFHPYFKPGQTIRGTVKTSGKPSRIVVRLRDAAGRILVQQAGADFKFPVDSWMPMLMRVEATLYDGDADVASSYRYVRVPRSRQGRFNFVLWNYPSRETLAPYAAATLKRMGVTAVYETSAGMSAAAHDMVLVPWTGGRINNSKAGDWNKPKFAEYWVKSTSRASNHGVLSYSLGDEGHTSGYAGDPLTIGVFRDFLKAGYQTIEGLNTSWETGFGSFEEITVLDGKQELPALKDAPLPNLSRDYDAFAFSGYNFVKMAKMHVEQMREAHDPDAVIGFEGAGEFAKTTDPELICRELGMWAPYGGHVDELIRSVAPRDFQRSNWMGYHHTADGHLSRYYYSLCNGGDSIWYWMWSTMGAWQGFQHPDLSGGVPAVEEFVEDTRFVREGLGDLLLRYEMQDDEIAMFYSRASVFVANRKVIDAYGPYKWTHMTWSTAIHDQGMQYRYVTDRMFQRGEFDASGYKVLVLPVAYGISPQAAKAMRDFVKRGGTLIADYRPGIYDHHARPYDAKSGKGTLDDLFGIRASLPIETDQVKQTKIEGTLGDQAITAFTNPNRETIAGTGITLSGAKALGMAGDHPVCIVNMVGKGRAILLNFALWSIMNARTETPNLGGQANVEETPHHVSLLLSELLKSAGAERTYKLAPYKNPAKHEFVGNLEVQRWQNGDYEIVSFFRQTGIREVSGRWAHVHFNKPFDREPKHRFVYDIRNKVSVGQQFEGWNWVHDIVPARAGFYVVMAEKCHAPELELPDAVVRGTVVRGKLSVPKAGGLHAIKIRVRGPDNTPANAFDQTIICDDKPQPLVLPIAFNDPQGTWTVQATDVFTDETEQVLTFEVK